MLEHGSRARGNRLGDRAEAACSANATQDADVRNMICWEAVIELARRTSVINQSRQVAWLRGLRPAPGQALDWEGILPEGCPDVLTMTQFRSVPRGSIVGFFKWRSGNIYLSHVGIALANGKVAGTNGAAVGLSNAMAIADMSNFAWGTGRAGSSYSYLENGQRVSVLIRYRDIDDIGFSQTCDVM